MVLIAVLRKRACRETMRSLRFAAAVVSVFLHIRDTAPATAQFFITPPGTTCNNDTRLASPIAGRMWCADSTTNTINGWDGTYWQSANALSTGITNVKDAGFGAKGA